jgi:hypothetical protein
MYYRLGTINLGDLAQYKIHTVFYMLFFVKGDTILIYIYTYTYTHTSVMQLEQASVEMYTLSKIK